MTEEIIESYQVGKSGKYGDILTERKVFKKPKVGLLAFGYFEYWRMYRGLREEVENDMLKIVNNMKKSKKYDVIYPGFIDTVDKADSAGKILKNEDINLLVVTEGTYMPDYLVLQAIRQLEHIQVVILITQNRRTLNRKDLSYRDVVGSSGFVGLSQLCGSFAKMGWNREVILGPIDDPDIYREIEQYALVAGVINRLKNLKIGAYGHPFRGMFDIEYDKTKLFGNIGPETIYIEEQHLKKALNHVKEKDINNLAAVTKKRFKIIGVSEATIRKGCRTAIALKNLVKEFNLDVVSILSQWNIQMIADDTAGYASSLLIEKGTMVSCEGDVATLALMDILHYFSGTSPIYGEFSMYDLKDNAIIFHHHGDGDPNLADNKDDVYLTSCPESWGCGEALAFNYVVKKGIATVCGIIDDACEQKMYIARGQSLGGESFNIHSPLCYFKPERPVLEFLKLMTESGFRHHSVIVLGDYLKHLMLLAKFLNINLVVL
jgi:L-arabinose isomerase